MAYNPISRTVTQYVDSTGAPYSGAVLKAYIAGTSTVLSMATDSTGGTTATSMALNSDGFVEVSGSIIIPHVDQTFKLALYPTQTDADANTGAIWTVDNISAAESIFGTTFSSQSTNFNVTTNDRGKFYSITGTTTATLLAAATAGTNFPVIFSNDGTGTVTIDPNASETINGVSTWSLLPGEAMIIVCDGSNWLGTSYIKSDASGNIGINTNSPDNNFHIFKASAGTISSNASSIMTLENSGTTYLQFLTANTDTAAILFGDPDSNSSGRFGYDHSTDTAYIVAADSTILYGKTGIYTPSATGGDQGVDTINASGLYIDGVSLGTLATIQNYASGNYIEEKQNSTPSLLSPGPSVSTKMCEIYSTRSGTINSRMAIKRTGTSADSLYCRIHVNGTGTGTLRNIGSADSTRNTWNEDISVSAGDLVQIYCYSSNTSNTIALDYCWLGILCSIPSASGGTYTFDYDIY